MDTRREFIKKAALLSGATGFWGALPASIQKALAIDPEPGSTWMDAEHVVILMQENRSFDHCFGTLQGVRGFNDPRAIRLPNGNPVWLQTNRAGNTYAPFRLNIKETKATWMGSLPHSWTDQVDARNGGRHDKWLIAKPSGHKDYADMPLTLGYYNREDIPFYYAFADAFTVCDQHFCSSLTGTTPNRLYLWTGTIREEQNAESPANVLNENVDYGVEAKWTTFPERLEDKGISWKIYQNELSLPCGFQGEEEDWLANFTDNPIEWFTQYRVRFATGYRAHLDRSVAALKAEVASLEKRAQAPNAAPADAEKTRQELATKMEQLARLEADREKWSIENFRKLPERDQNLHNRAFCTNTGDPFYHELTSLTYKDGDTERTVQIPKGDVLHQFRSDVKGGKLPTVSWLVASSNFSDHPGSAWYGAWYVSEALDILTQNPEVWKKTIFILTYDENDGYFDHVPPFVAPDPRRPETGRASDGIDTRVEYVTMEQERKRKPERQARECSIGLGYRVPLIVASPWSRGGCVCSQVFDHTSVLQFLEKFLSHKTGGKVEESNISSWRRAVCGDLTSIFQPYHGEKIAAPSFPTREAFFQSIHQAKFKGLPSGYRGLTAEEIEEAKKSPSRSPRLPRQERGIRKACPLPYQLYAEGALNEEKDRISLRMEARNEVFGDRAAGSPFNVFALGGPEGMRLRAYAVRAGDGLDDSWSLDSFGDDGYHLQVHGPNGFLRELAGTRSDPMLSIRTDYAWEKGGSRLSGPVEVTVWNRDSRPHTVELRDNAYGHAAQTRAVPAGGKTTLRVDTKRSYGWYDFTIRAASDSSFSRRCAGRVETGAWSYSDPAMGNPASQG